jgi:glycosyltransferase involved in cell wall biosynthesis
LFCGILAEMSARLRDAPRPLPVLFLVPNLATGGAERQLAELVTRMDPARFRPLVVCLKTGGPFSDQIRAAGIEVLHLGFRAGWDPRFPWRLARICRERGIRALVLRDFSTGAVGRVVGRALGIRPVIMAEHSTGTVTPMRRHRVLERVLAPWCDGVIAVAEGQIPFLVGEKGHRRDRIRVIYNGIDVDRWSPRPPSRKILTEFAVPPDAPVVGIVAMLRPEKDHATFLRAAERLAARLPAARFFVVGEGTERAYLQRLAGELDLAGRVHFTGRRADVADLLSTFDACVLCSYTVETFPMAFLEAMALERPIVGTRVGGLPEMIDEGRNGFLVPPRDPEALAEALYRVVADREVARAMGRESRRLVRERFSVERMVRETERFIDSFFASNGLPA